MAQRGLHLDTETISCPVCLDLLKDPVTIPCGHNYCLSCVRDHWDREDDKGIYSCPQCRKIFIPRPELLKNTTLAAVVEQLKKTGVQAAPADHCYAGAEDVACDVCTGRKLKALKSCLLCLVSFCANHLQPHLQSPAFSKHQLVEPSNNLRDNICSEHDEVMKMFCRSDQQCICSLCSVDQHKGHDIVSAAAERREKQKKLPETQQRIQQSIRDTEGELKELQQEAKDVKLSADEAVEHSHKIYSQLIRLMQERSCEVEQQIRSQQEAEVRRLKELEEKLEQELSELRSKAAQLQQLPLIEDHCRFLQHDSSARVQAASTGSSGLRIRPGRRRRFQEVRAAVSESGQKMRRLLSDSWANISPSEVELWPAAEPTTREEFLRYSADLTLDPNTAGMRMLLSEGNRGATFMKKNPPRPHRPDRFRTYSQDSSGLHIRPGRRVEDVTASVSDSSRKIQRLQEDTWTNISLSEVELWPAAEPTTREEFLRYSAELTLDPNTAHTHMLLSEGNRRATFMKKNQHHPHHADRFRGWCQALSRESLTGPCYWEVKVSERGARVAVAYKNISRAGDESGFGDNDKSWALRCSNQSYKFVFNNEWCDVSGPWSSRVGVYLDRAAGLLSFYSVSDSMTLLHTVHTSFTQPLHAGLWLWSGSSSELVKLG